MTNILSTKKGIKNLNKMMNHFSIHFKENCIFFNNQLDNGIFLVFVSFENLIALLDINKEANWKNGQIGVNSAGELTNLLLLNDQNRSGLIDLIKLKIK